MLSDISLKQGMIIDTTALYILTVLCVANECQARDGGSAASQMCLLL